MKGEKKAGLLNTIADLERRLFEARSQFAATIGAAFDQVQKAGTDNFTASGVILEITAIGGKQIVAPVMIRDGISAATIAAIQNDLRRSFELATMVNPAMARGEK